jgi:ABC-type phosphate transport system substrate-binding protein
MRPRQPLLRTARPLAALVTSAALLAPALSAPAADAWVVVVNTESALRRIQRDDLARIYLGKKTLWEDTGTRIAPVMLDEGSSLTRAFLEGTVKKSLSQYRAYWKRLLFSGGGAAPKTFRQSSQVIDFVARSPGGIGIVDASAVDARVRTVETFD